MNPIKKHKDIYTIYPLTRTNIQLEKLKYSTKYKSTKYRLNATQGNLTNKTKQFKLHDIFEWLQYTCTNL